MHESSLGMDRLARSAHGADINGPYSDVDGNHIFVGDLVVVVDKNHDFYELVEMVRKMLPSGR